MERLIIDWNHKYSFCMLLNNKHLGFNEIFFSLIIDKLIARFLQPGKLLFIINRMRF